MITYSKCELSKKFVLCYLNSKNYTIPIGKNFLRLKLYIIDSNKMDKLIESSNLDVAYCKVKIAGHHFNGSYFFTDDENIIKTVCDKFNSILVVEKMSNGD